jgi:hypothetical protein
MCTVRSFITVLSFSSSCPLPPFLLILPHHLPSLHPPRPPLLFFFSSPLPSPTLSSLLLIFLSFLFYSSSLWQIGSFDLFPIIINSKLWTLETVWHLGRGSTHSKAAITKAKNT